MHSQGASVLYPCLPAESELHSIVSGCSDGIYITRCLEFRTGKEVEHFQWTDNSAARQLVSRQGVGRIRHLSGKLLWVQDLVLSKQLAIGQIPTEWSYSDVGTKPLTRSCMMVLLHQIGGIDPNNLQMVGQEEFDAVASRLVGQQNLKRVAKTIYRMAALWGLESLGQSSAEVAAVWLLQMVLALLVMKSKQFALAFMLVLWVTFAVVAYKVFKKLRNDLEQCWGQVADEDSLHSSPGRTHRHFEWKSGHGGWKIG